MAFSLLVIGCLQASSRPIQSQPGCPPSAYVNPVPNPDRVATVWNARKKFRLVIGAGKFLKDSTQDRPSVHLNATAVDNALINAGYKDSLGLLLDEKATKKAVVDALTNLGNLPEDALAVVYYIGHGIPVSGGDDLRLSVADEPVSAFNGVPVRELLQQALGPTDPYFRKIPRVIFIIETCYSGAANGFFVDRLYQQLGSAKRLVLITATSDKEQARPLKTGGLFAFGAYLVQALNQDWACADITPDGALTALELRTYLAGRLKTAKDQGEIDGVMTPAIADFGLYSTIAYRPDRVADLRGFREAIVEYYADAAPGVTIELRTAEGRQLKQCMGSCGVLTDSPELINTEFRLEGFTTKMISGVDVRDRFTMEALSDPALGKPSAHLGVVQIRR